jgi:hypothetical protein
VFLVRKLNVDVHINAHGSWYDACIPVKILYIYYIYYIYGNITQDRHRLTIPLPARLDDNGCFHHMLVGVCLSARVCVCVC